MRSVGKVGASIIGALMSAALMAAQGGVTGAVDSATRLIDGGSGLDWAGFGGSFGEQHFSPLTQINAGTVGKLGLAWKIDLPPGNTATAPLAVDGTLYFVTGLGLVHAVDARTGRKLWDYDARVHEAKGQRKVGEAWGPRGIAWWNGKIYLGTMDGRLIAIDAATGKLVWSQQTVPLENFDYITGAPRVFDGKVIIGFGGADINWTRGYVTTYDAETGVVAGGGAPELRSSDVPASAEAFHGIVKDGALLPAGMPRFDYLGDADIEDMRQYIRSRAAAWRTGAKGPSVPARTSTGR